MVKDAHQTMSDSIICGAECARVTGCVGFGVKNGECSYLSGHAPSLDKNESVMYDVEWVSGDSINLND